MTMYPRAYTHAASQRVSSGGKTRVRFVLFFVFIFPFVNAFGKMHYVSPIFEGFSIGSYVNYFAILFASYLLLGQKKIRFHRLVVTLTAFLLLILVANYVVAPLASTKWFINWLGFIWFSVVLIQVIKNFTEPELFLLEVLCLKWLRRLFGAIAVTIAIVWLSNFPFFLEMLAGFKGDQVNALLSYNVGLEKQALGTLFALFVFMFVVFFSRLNNKNRIAFAIGLLVFLPSIIFIRTLYLAASLVLVWLFFTKYKLRRAVMYFGVMLLAVLMFLNAEKLALLVETSYDRLPSLRFAWSAMSENMFGLGNGGYHIYVEQYQNKISSMFGSEAMVAKNIFWTAPESDLVYFIASWGVLSVLFFIYFAVILVKGASIFHNNKKILLVEKVILLMAFTMIFSGISQDNAGSLIWWVYLAAGSGVVLRHLRKRNAVLVMPVQQRQECN